MNKTIPEQVTELLRQGYTLQEAIDTVTRKADCAKCEPKPKGKRK